MGVCMPVRGFAEAKRETFDDLLARVRACAVCAPHLPLGPRPVLRGRTSARLLIISQAPGKRVHETGLSFDDRSGDRLRDWLALDRETFYDEARVAIMPIGFCYPGRGCEIANEVRAIITLHKALVGYSEF